MKGRVKLPFLDWIKLIIISSLVICSVMFFAFSCNVAIVSCFKFIGK